ncbi:MAG: hypothetical protein OQK82_01265 [Candidatus Pacearchaeota archaeon]|nr:hypothetical protein [Candidatus Pacearchaeota archaeon]
MKPIYIFVALLLFKLASANSMNEFTLSNYSYGPVKIGMKKQQVNALLNKTLVDASEHKSEESCHISLYNNKELEFMFENGILTVIKTHSKNIHTSDNITIGSSKESVIKAYKSKLSVDNHEEYYGLLAQINENNKDYKPTEEYITYYVSYGVNKPILKIETFNGYVTSIAAGILPSIDYKEGCL